MLEFGPETVLIIVGFGLSIFTIVSAIIHRPWGLRRHSAAEPLEAVVGIDLDLKKAPENEARRDDTIRSFIAAIEIERTDSHRQ